MAKLPKTVTAEIIDGMDYRPRFGSIGVGDVLRMRRWQHCEPHIELSYNVGNRKDVAVFLYLGTEPRDGSQPLDLEAVMNRLGWSKT